MVIFIQFSILEDFDFWILVFEQNIEFRLQFRAELSGTRLKNRYFGEIRTSGLFTQNDTFDQNNFFLLIAESLFYKIGIQFIKINKQNFRKFFFSYFSNYISKLRLHFFVIIQ